MHNLQYYLTASPLSAVYTMLLGCSMLIVFDSAGIYLFKQRTLWIRSLYFFTGLLITSNLILLFAAFSIISPLLLQTFAAAFIITAIAIGIKNRVSAKIKNLYFFVCGTGNKWLGYLIAVVIIALLLVSLSPPTDGDSLDYHLGVPVEILNIKNIWLNKDNLHFRMFGFGEMLNLFGLANGCAQFGAFIQYISMLWLLIVFATVVPANNRKNVIALCLALPVLLFLLPSQKHQLTGIACTSICFAIVHRYAHLLNGRIIGLFICTIIFAAGIKYSFILSSIALITFFLFRARTYIAFAGYFAVCSIVFLLPLLFIKYIHYNDPLSPLLEGYIGDGNPLIIKLSHALRNYSDSKIPFPSGLLLPRSWGHISTILGCCVLLLVTIVYYIRKYAIAVGTICIFILLTLFLGQRTSRFFIEPYMWAVMVIFTAQSVPAFIKKILLLCKIQFILLVPLFVLTGLMLPRGIISDKHRDKVMKKYSSGYAETLWIDTLLPENAVVLTNIRSRSLLPRKYYPLEYIYSISDSIRQDDMIYNKYKVNYLVSIKKFPKFITKRYAGDIVARKTFVSATRNPFNKKEYEVVVYKIK